MTISPPLRLPIAASMGDPAGVGAELLCAAWARRDGEGLPAFLVVGSAAVLEAAAVRRGLSVPVLTVASPEEALACFGEALPVIDLGPAEYAPGTPTDSGAALALAALDRATALARTGQAAALVTAPVSKARLATAGFTHPGQTEFVAEACGVLPHDAVMMLAGPVLRVVPVTVHVALRDVPDLLTSALIHGRSAIAAAALASDFGIASPRLAVAGLNPHAGEDGRMGSEDIEIVAPAVASLRAQGIDAVGPLPPDTMFHAEARARYDLAVCMYHDQALIPLKALDFDAGVNVTLGLPIVRTSPDHGTAFSLAGTGEAREGATMAAIRMAGECAARRQSAA